MSIASSIGSTDPLRFQDRLALGKIPGLSLRQLFGVGTVGTAFQPLLGQSSSTTYSYLSSAASLEVVSTDANDTAAGSGARRVQFSYIDAAGALQVSPILALNGTTAVTSGVPSGLRVEDIWVVDQGTYGQIGTGNAGEIRVQTSGGGTVHRRMPAGAGKAVGASMTVPLGYRALLYGGRVDMPAGTAVDIALYSRPLLTRASAPFGPMRELRKWEGRTGSFSLLLPMPLELPEASDFALAAKVASSTALVTATLDLALVAL